MIFILERTPFWAKGVISGLLLSLSHGFSSWLAWFAPLPLFHGLHRSVSVRTAWWGGFVCGLGEAAVLSGLFFAGWQVGLGLTLYYALQRGVFSVLVRTLAPDRRWGWSVTVAALWVALEWIHAQVPYALPNLLGDTQHDSLLLFLAPWVGTYGISAVLVLFTAGWIAGVYRPPRWGALGGVGLVLTLIFAAAVSSPKASGMPFKVNIVQGGLPNWVYERGRGDTLWQEFPLAVYRNLTVQARLADLTVWPETAVSQVWPNNRTFVQQMYRLRNDRGGVLLFGVPRSDAASRSMLNSAVALGPDFSRLLDKRRLALHAERAFAPGTRLNLLQSALPPIGVVFCLESVVPEYVRELVIEGAGTIVVLADGSLFRQTVVGRLHAQRSRLRAAEVGRPIIHAGQHGYSALIEEDGTLVQSASVFQADVLHGVVRPRGGQTTWVRFGPLVVWLAMLWIAARLVAKAIETGRRLYQA